MCLSVCTSVCMEQLVSQWTNFYEIWYLSIFRKICWESSSLSLEAFTATEFKEPFSGRQPRQVVKLFRKPRKTFTFWRVCLPRENFIKFKFLSILTRITGTWREAKYTWVISKVLHPVCFLFKNEFILQNTFTDLQCNLHCALSQRSNVWARLVFLSERLQPTRLWLVPKIEETVSWETLQKHWGDV
jgi:hypothetical protein